jgi:hypothetical protein
MAMKTKNLLVGLLLFIFSNSFTSCTPDQDYSTSTKDILSAGKWSVDYYYAGQDMTTQYTSYEFTFQGNGVVSGKTANGEFTGNWALLKDVNYNEVVELNINTQEPELIALNELWKVTNKSLTVISMNGASMELRIRKL